MKRCEAEFVRSRWCSLIWSMYVVTIRGAIAFQRLFTFSNETGLRLCGIVELPTCSAANAYRQALRERQETEARTLASTTGWRVSDVRRKAGLGSKPAQVTAVEKPWWQRMWSW